MSKIIRLNASEVSVFIDRHDFKRRDDLVKSMIRTQFPHIDQAREDIKRINDKFLDIGEYEDVNAKFLLLTHINGKIPSTLNGSILDFIEKSEKIPGEVTGQDEDNKEDNPNLPGVPDIPVVIDKHLLTMISDKTFRNNYNEFVKILNKFDFRNEHFIELTRNDEEVSMTKEIMYLEFEDSLCKYLNSINCNGLKMIEEMRQVIMNRFYENFEGNFVKVYGIYNEGRVIEKVEDSKKIIVSNRNSEVKEMRIPLDNGYVMLIKGMVDGINKADGELIEVKNRKNLYNNENLHYHEDVQVRVYLEMFDYNKCRIVENSGESMRTFVINRDDCEWQSIKNMIIKYGNEFVKIIG